MHTHMYTRVLIILAILNFQLKKNYMCDILEKLSYKMLSNLKQLWLRPIYLFWKYSQWQKIDPKITPLLKIKERDITKTRITCLHFDAASCLRCKCLMKKNHFFFIHILPFFNKYDIIRATKNLIFNKNTKPLKIVYI